MNSVMKTYARESLKTWVVGALHPLHIKSISIIKERQTIQVGSDLRSRFIHFDEFQNQPILLFIGMIHQLQPPVKQVEVFQLRNS